MEVLDYYSPKDRDTIAQFQTQGIARYLTNSPNDIRQVTKQEVDDALALGLSVHFFYEMNPTYPAYFTHAQGQEDCRQAQWRLAELGAPRDTVVYFTVDTNIEPSLCDEYFNGVESGVTPAIIPGAYGYQRFCEYAYANFPNVGKHLWQTYGRPTVPLDGYQHLQEVRAGVEVDVNDVSVSGWTTTVPTSATEVDVSFKDDPDAIAYREDVKATLEEIKAVLGTSAHHTHIYAGKTTPDLVVGGRTSQPLIPPVPGAAYFSSSDDLSTIGWAYPDTVIHFWQNGVELVK